MAAEKTYGSSTLILPMHYSSIFLLSPIIFFGVASLIFFFLRSLLYCTIKWFAGGTETLNVIQNCKNERNVRNCVELTKDDTEASIMEERASERVREHRIEFISVCCSTTVQACNYLVWFRTQNGVRFKSVSLSLSLAIALSRRALSGAIAWTQHARNTCTAPQAGDALCEPRCVMYIL